MKYKQQVNLSAEYKPSEEYIKSIQRLFNRKS
jgi:hypothetical protein